MSEETKSVKILGVTIVKDDIVFIKFKKLEDVLRDKRATARVHELMDFYKIDQHLTAFLAGTGHFKITDISGENDYLRLSPDRSPSSRRNKRSALSASPANPAAPETLQEEITILDHNQDTAWILNELLIEEIRVETDSVDSYFSENHQLSIVRIDSVLFLNGQPLTSTDSKIFEMFEKVLADAAIARLFADDNEKSDNNENKF